MTLLSGSWKFRRRVWTDAAAQFSALPMIERETAPNTHPDDALAGIEVTGDFEPFRQRNDIFTRAFWDSSIRSNKTDRFFASYRIEAAPRRGDGFQHRDFALRNAAWLVSDVLSSARGAEHGIRDGFQAASLQRNFCGWKLETLRDKI